MKGAVAAFSLRNLNPDATKAIRIRETGSDNEVDIGFDLEGNLATGDIASFCGSNDGMVVKWYDQTLGVNNGGNPVDAVAKDNDATKQPIIYDASESPKILQQYGRPRISFANYILQTPFFETAFAQPNTIFCVGDPSGTSGAYVYDGNVAVPDSSTSSRRTAFFRGSIWAGNSLSFATSSNGQGTALYNSTNSVFRLNGSELATGNAGTQSLGGVTLGGRYSFTNVFDAKVLEYIAYNSDKTSDFSRIESNMANYYTLP